MSCTPGRVHHWILESSDQAAKTGRKGTSMGICKHCEQQKEFENSIPDSAVNHLSLGSNK